MTSFVLVHSPLVGPTTWRPVADRLRQRGHEVVVPSLSGLGDDPQPSWPRLVDAVATATPDDAVLVAHSNAGLLVPQLVHRRGPLAVVFVDARLPPRGGRCAMASPEFREFLVGLAVDDRLPPWTRWWASDTDALFPDSTTRAAFQEEEPQLPLSYFDQEVPVPAGWDRVRLHYLQFSPAYDEDARDAVARGIPVTHLPAEHLHMLVDPDAVANALLQMVSS